MNMLTDAEDVRHGEGCVDEALHVEETTRLIDEIRRTADFLGQEISSQYQGYRWIRVRRELAVPCTEREGSPCVSTAHHAAETHFLQEQLCVLQEQRRDAETSWTTDRSGGSEEWN
eukprot:TRINITY_DN45979_c0_g1_i1.p2 TRINITY_DN45979_c0_g1~~TRINITY_DN45979_c0_g1_i1.p2  ORF type:complete len:116 (+),score=17.03 TRINITY_DN45979_c0_g1_i1:103-450(+)